MRLPLSRAGIAQHLHPVRLPDHPLPMQGRHFRHNAWGMRRVYQRPALRSMYSPLNRNPPSRRGGFVLAKPPTIHHHLSPFAILHPYQNPPPDHAVGKDFLPISDRDL